MNPRIAFAFARGARVQYFYQIRWEEALSHNKSSSYEWRIHPSDEHLQYGPVSSRVRAAALSQPFRDAVQEQYGLEFVAELSGIYPRDFNDEDHWHMYELIMAEALADEGL